MTHELINDTYNLVKEKHQQLLEKEKTFQHRQEY